MNNRQVVFAAIVLGLVAALVVWWLEQFNKERMIAELRAELDKLPTFKREGETNA